MSMTRMGSVVYGATMLTAPGYGRPRRLPHGFGAAWRRPTRALPSAACSHHAPRSTRSQEAPPYVVCCKMDGWSAGKRHADTLEPYRLRYLRAPLHGVGRGAEPAER